MDQGRRARRRAAGLAALALALPLAGCASPGWLAATAHDLVRADCPNDIRIQLDDLPRVESAYLYRLLDLREARFVRHGISAPLIADGARTGVDLTILNGDADDGVSADRAIYGDADDDPVLLAAVDTDAAILDHVRYPSVGVFAPLAHDPSTVYWRSDVYPAATGIESLGRTLTPDGSARVPILVTPDDPLAAYLVGAGVVTADAIASAPDGTAQPFLDAGGVSAAEGDVLVDPARFDAEHLDLPVRSQSVERTGYTRDTDVLAASPRSLVRYADCLTALVPILQQSLVDAVHDPDGSSALVAKLSAASGDPGYDEATARAAFETMIEEKIVGDGHDDTIGDLDIGRVRSLLEDAVPAWRKAGLSVPRGVEPEDIMTRSFVDETIGLGSS